MSKFYPNAKMPIRNIKIAAQINIMHEKWRTEQFPSRVAKMEADPFSVNQIKMQNHCHRYKARQIKQANGV